MNYSHVIKKLDDIDDRKKLVAKLNAPKRNKLIAIFHDYYDGLQWMFSGGDVSTTNHGNSRTTRSLKEMWKPLNDGEPDTGYTAGQLRVWNIIKNAVDAYTDYVRGDSNDKTKITIQMPDKTSNDDLSVESMAIFGDDLDEFIVNATQMSCITSVAPTKYTAYKNTDVSDRKVLSKIYLQDDDEVSASVELVDPMQLEPLYWESKKRGYIRFYKIDCDEANELINKGFDSKDGELYWECWYIDDNGKIVLKKYVNEHEVETINNVYDYMPYYLQPNKKHNKHNFDLDHTEVSDVDDLVELQDDLNAYLTDLGIIHRNVALPMLKVMDEFVKNAHKNGMDFDKLKQMIRTLRTEAGQIIVGPLEKMPATGAADSQMRYLQDIFDQFYRDTRIPRSLLNSDGLSNMSGDALDNLFQSLRVVIGRKRTNAAKIIAYNVKVHLKTMGKWQQGMTIKIEMPDIFAISRSQRADILVKASQNGLPSTYIIGEFADLLGDGEKREELIASAGEEDSAIKQQIESQLTRREIFENTTRTAAVVANNVNQLTTSTPVSA